MAPLFAELVTHLIAFALFAWILKKFAWRPILGVLDRRRERIGELMKRAEEAENEAKETQDLFDQRLRALDAEADQKLIEAFRQGEKEAENLTEKARKEAGEILAQAHLAADRETERARIALKGEMAHLAVQVATQSLGDVVDANLRQRLLERATKHLAGGPHSPTSGEGGKNGSDGSPGGGGQNSRKSSHPS